jgi:hypothetical protein
MLVAKFNAVNVESVPLKSDEFRVLGQHIAVVASSAPRHLHPHLAVVADVIGCGSLLPRLPECPAQLARRRHRGHAHVPRRPDPRAAADPGGPGRRPCTLVIVAVSARRTGARALIGQADSMGVKGVAAALMIATGSGVVLSAPASAASDEDQVRAVLNVMNGSYNRSDFEAFASHVCADLVSSSGYEAGWYASRRSDGPTQISVNSVSVKANEAVANVRFVAANRVDTKTFDIDFLGEDAEWKACRYHTGQFI